MSELPKRPKSVLDPEPLLAGAGWSPPAGEGALADVLARVHGAIRAMPTPEEAEARVNAVMLANVHGLRAESGRLDAAAIASALTISLSDLACAMKVFPRALCDSPDAESWQAALGVYARVAAALRDLIPDEQARRVWLERPQPRWYKRSARQEILGGNAESVAHLLERIRDGGGGE